MTLGNHQLVVQHASVGTKAGQPGFPNLLYEQFLVIPWPIMPPHNVSKGNAWVLLMLNMVMPDNPH